MAERLNPQNRRAAEPQNRVDRERIHSMPHPFDITSPSPDMQHTAHFSYSGDIRCVPAYFALAVDGYSFGQRIFGDAQLWSPESTLLAVQEWLTLDYSAGPIT